MKYFVLKPAGDSPYHHASRAAMHKYAFFIEKQNPELAKELREWATKEEKAHYERMPTKIPDAYDGRR